MKKFQFYYSYILLLIFSSCSSNITEDYTTGNIAGSVSDQTTGEPVSTVNVSLNPSGSSTVTGSDGTFSFNDLQEGSYTITITKDGYKDNNRTVYIPTGETTPVHLLIERIPASITSDKNLLDFGETLSTLSFTIVNTGYTDLKYLVETGNCKWLSVEPENDVLKYGKTATIVVTITRELLPKGQNEANIVVSSTSGDGNVEIKVTAINNAGAIVNTLEPTDITNTTAVLNGEVINEGIPSYTERGFVIDTQQTPTTSTNFKKLSSPVGSEKKFSCTIDGLSSSQTYYVRSYLVQNENTIYGNIISFTTSQQATIITTSAVSQIGATSATFNASISNEGVPAYTEKGFCYSKSNTPTISDNRKSVSGTGTGNFSLQITNLEYPVTYYVRAYAIQNGEVVYGNIVSFSTHQQTTSISTSAVTQIEATSATFNASISNEGLPAYSERGFCYSKSSTPTISNNRKPVSGTGTGNFSLQVTGLEFPVTYYVRAYAIQADEIVYGNIVSFSTISRSVIVGTSSATEITTNSATLNGVISDVGLPNYSQRGFCYSSSNPSPTIADERTSQYASNSGSFYKKISNLNEGTTYYVKAYAMQNNQYVYGNTISFTTNATPAVQTDAVTSLEKIEVGGFGYYQWYATFNATVIKTGDPAYTERGFVYDTSIDPTISDNKIQLSGSGLGSYSATVSNLYPNYTFYVRAYVKVGNKYYYGENVTFSTY